jgi:hypothetical protein
LTRPKTWSMVYWRSSMVLTDTSTSLGLWWKFGVFVVNWCVCGGNLVFCDRGVVTGTKGVAQKGNLIRWV